MLFLLYLLTCNTTAGDFTVIFLLVTSEWQKPTPCKSQMRIWKCCKANLQSFNKEKKNSPVPMDYTVLVFCGGGGGLVLLFLFVLGQGEGGRVDCQDC